jgi:hypothetical protein
MRAFGTVLEKVAREFGFGGAKIVEIEVRVMQSAEPVEILGLFLISERYQFKNIADVEAVFTCAIEQRDRDELLSG